MKTLIFALLAKKFEKENRVICEIEKLLAAEEALGRKGFLQPMKQNLFIVAIPENEIYGNSEDITLVA